MTIDVHTHIEPGEANVVYEGRNFRTVLDRCWSPAHRVDEMPQMGVDKQVLSPMPRLLNYDLEADDAVDLARYMNEVIVKMIDEQPDRFYGLGAVPLQHVDLAARELQRIKELGLLGVEVQTNIAGKNPGDAEFLPFLKEAESLGLSIFSHDQNPTFVDRIVGQEATNAVGFPIENAFAVAGVITGRVLEECPNLRICFSHGGGVGVQLLPRMQSQWASGGALRELLPNSPLEYARECYYDDDVFDATTLRYLIDMVGVSQIVVGSDYPFGGDFRFKTTPEREFDDLRSDEEGAGGDRVQDGRAVYRCTTVRWRPARQPPQAVHSSYPSLNNRRHAA